MSFKNGHGKDFPCKKCANLYSDESSLKRHVEKYHKEVYKINCKVCSRSVSSSAELMKHVIMVHGGRKVHKCQLCDRIFSQADYLSKHKKVFQAKNS